MGIPESLKWEVVSLRRYPFSLPCIYSTGITRRARFGFRRWCPRLHHRMYGVVDWIQRRGGMLPPSAGAREVTDAVLYCRLGAVFYAMNAAARRRHSIFIV